jgi:signal transduction histidine kinase
MFEPFVSEGKEHGTGLGMTIVKKILDEHHGHIEVHSVVGRGTTIHISLPRTQKFRENEKLLKETLAGNY